MQFVPSQPGCCGGVRGGERDGNTAQAAQQAAKRQVCVVVGRRYSYADTAGDFNTCANCWLARATLPHAQPSPQKPGHALNPTLTGAGSSTIWNTLRTTIGPLHARDMISIAYWLYLHTRIV